MVLCVVTVLIRVMFCDIVVFVVVIVFVVVVVVLVGNVW